MDKLDLNIHNYELKAKKENIFSLENVTVSFPPNTFYDDFYMNFEVKQNSLFLENEYIPVHSNFLVSVTDSISKKEDKEKK